MSEQPVCRRCKRPLWEHTVYHDEPPDDVVVQYGEFDGPFTGYVCPVEFL